VCFVVLLAVVAAFSRRSRRCDSHRRRASEGLMSWLSQVAPSPRPRCARSLSGGVLRSRPSPGSPASSRSSSPSSRSAPDSRGASADRLTRERPRDA
jgi:hypothetical protein